MSRYNSTVVSMKIYCVVLSGLVSKILLGCIDLHMLIEQDLCFGTSCTKCKYARERDY